MKQCLTDELEDNGKVSRRAKWTFKHLPVLNFSLCLCPLSIFLQKMPTLDTASCEHGKSSDKVTAEWCQLKDIYTGTFHPKMVVCVCIIWQTLSTRWVWRKFPPRQAKHRIIFTSSLEIRKMSKMYYLFSPTNFKIQILEPWTLFSRNLLSPIYKKLQALPTNTESHLNENVNERSEGCQYLMMGLRPLQQTGGSIRTHIGGIVPTMLSAICTISVPC